MKFDVMRSSGKDQVTGEYKDLKRLNYLIVPCEALLSVHPLKVMPSSTYQNHAAHLKIKASKTVINAGFGGFAY